MKLFFLFFVGGACFAARFSTVSSQVLQQAPFQQKPEVNGNEDGKPVLKSNDIRSCTTLGNPILPIRNLFDLAMGTEFNKTYYTGNEPVKVINILFEPLLDGFYTFTYLTRIKFSGTETECKLKLIYNALKTDSPYLLSNICNLNDNEIPFVLITC